MENDQNIIYRFSKMNTQIKLIVLWISLIILFSYTDIFYSLHMIIKYSPNAEKYYRIKSLIENKLSFLNISRIVFYNIIAIVALMIELTPVFIIIANIFIKKNIINYINIIVGFIYVITAIIILLYKNRSYYSQLEVIMCIVEILILAFIIIKSIQRLIIKQVKIENHQNIVFKFNKINTRIMLIVLWVSLIILYDYFTFMFDSFLELIRFSPIAEKISHNIFLKSQELIHQLLMDSIHGKEFNNTKFLAVKILDFINSPPITYFIAELMIKLMPVLIIIANLFIKKNIINYINIITGVVYVLIGILTLFYYNRYSDDLVNYILSTVEILILILIIIKSIQEKIIDKKIY